MTDAKTTSEIQTITGAAIVQQSALCEAKRENLEDRLADLARTVAANASNITALTATMGTINNEIVKLKTRPAIWAFAGAALPVIVQLFLEWRQ